jgi:hypothetical protein
VLGNTAAEPQRWYFSGAGDPESWDTTNSWIDGSFPGTGGAALRNALLIFANERVERIVGATPPPGTDMSLQTLYEPGCVDARSIVIADDTCFFANPTGLYQTDGSAVVDVTERGGMKRYWLETFASYTSSWTVACGRIRNWIAVSVMNGSTFVDGFLVHIYKRVWLRIANLKAVMFWSSIAAAPETFYGARDAARVRKLSSIFSPAAGVKNDADGTAVTPILETPWYPVGASKSPIRDIYSLYDLRDAASDQPAFTLSYLTSPEATSYSAVTDYAGNGNTLAETSEITRARRKIRKAVYGVALKVAQNNASSDSRIYRLEADDHKREPTRVG